MRCACMGDIKVLSSIITQIELARLSGVTRQVVSKAIRAGHIKVNRKRKVIFDDDLTQLWFQKQRSKNVETPLKQEPEAVPSVNLITLQQQKIIEEIGKIRADKKLKELQYTQKRDTLIEKDTVAAVLFQYIDALNINMLDIPDMIIDTILDKIKAGATRGDVIEIMRKSIRKSIVNTKKQIKERLK